MSTATTEFINNVTPASHVPGGKPKGLAGWNPTTIAALFIGAHMLLAYSTYTFPYITTLHAVLTIGVGVWWAAFGKRIDRVAYVGAYIVGSEVFWRMTHAGVFWEAGKYALVVIFTIAAIRARRQKTSPLPFIYFALLVPSIVITLTNLDASTARSEISFNLSGPLALAASVWFFSKVKLTLAQVRHILLALVASTMTVSSLALFLTLVAKAIQFGNESNFKTSGGFGPNQVSSILGLGALASFLYLMNRGISPTLRFLFFCTMTLYATQSALTLSREGVYEFAIGAVVYMLFQGRDLRSGLNFVLVGAVVFFLASWLLLPHLERFTGGVFGARFGSTDSTGRSSLIMDDLEVWRENPLFGIGPGRSIYYHRSLGLDEPVAAHTEFSRLLAEHGVLGLLAMIILAAMLFNAFRKTQSTRSRALTACFACYAVAFMFVAAMRVAAPSFIFGLATATFVSARKQDFTSSGSEPTVALPSVV